MTYTPDDPDGALTRYAAAYRAIEERGDLLTPTQPGQPDLGELRRLAEAATVGKWRRTLLPTGIGAAAFGRAIVNAEESGYPGAVLEGIRAEVDAAYIAAASPTVVLALLSRIEALETALRQLVDCADFVEECSPTAPPWDEAEYKEWLAFFDQACRVYFRIARGGKSVEK